VVNMQDAVGKIKSKGRYGDTQLMHVNPIEVKMLSDQIPGGLTTNPDTGLPEAFLPLALGMLGSWAAPAGWGAAAAGLGSFAGSMAQGDEFKDAALAGMTSFGLGSMMQAAAGPASAASGAPTSVSGGPNTPFGATGGTGRTAAAMASASPAPTVYNFGVPVNPYVGSGSVNPAFANADMSGKMDFMGKRLDEVGWQQVAKDAVTRNPVGTAAAGIGLLGGGTDAIMSQGPMPEIPDGTKKKYDYDTSEKLPNPARAYNKPGINYQPGVDPEFSYFTPRGIGYATGGAVGYGYDAGANKYDFNRTSSRAAPVSLTPTLPAPIAGHNPTIDVKTGVPRVESDGTGVQPPGPTDPMSHPNSSPIGAKTDAAGVLGGLALAGGVPLVGALLGGLAGAADAYQAEARGGRVTGFTPHISGAMHGASPFNVYGDSPQKQLDRHVAKTVDNFNTMGGRHVSEGWSGSEATGDPGNDTGTRGFYADGGQAQAPQGPDPLVMGAVAAIMGNHPEPQRAIQAFVQVHGQQAFAQLRAQVIESASEEQRGQEGLGGLIQGPGNGTSDSISGQIVQNGQPVEDIKVSNGEYILPEKAVEAFPEQKAGLDRFVANATGARPNNA
jgi:hypothetical protein